MTNEQTIEKMQKLKLFGMARAFQNLIQQKQNLTPDEMLAYLIDSEWDFKQNRKLERLLKSAKFRYQASFEEIDFNANRNLDKNQLLRMSDCSWITKKENILITGPTGVGKSYIACALGHNACLYGYKVLYSNAIKLFTQLKYCKADGTYIKEIEKIKNTDVFIIDDFGLEPLDFQNSISLLEIFEDRYNKKSTVISSQLPFKNWYDIITDKTIADAICDRIIQNTHKIELKGESLRRKRKNSV
jgi:DNA replication protein DnaC